MKFPRLLSLLFAVEQVVAQTHALFSFPAHDLIMRDMEQRMHTARQGHDELMASLHSDALLSMTTLASQYDFTHTHQSATDDLPSLLQQVLMQQLRAPTAPHPTFSIKHQASLSEGSEPAPGSALQQGLLMNSAATARHTEAVHSTDKQHSCRQHPEGHAVEPEGLTEHRGLTAKNLPRGLSDNQRSSYLHDNHDLQWPTGMDHQDDFRIMDADIDEPERDHVSSSDTDDEEDTVFIDPYPCMYLCD